MVEEVVRGSIIPRQVSRTGAVEEFEKLAVQYNELHISDEAERVAERMRLADRLGALYLQLEHARTKFPDTATEAQIVVLATAISIKPMRSDLDSLEKAAKIANFNFTRYRRLIPLSQVGQYVV